MTDKEKFAMLSDLRAYIESAPFQEFVMKPIKGELDKLKNAYDCESLRELSAMKGKRQGLMTLMDTIKKVEKEWQNTKFDLEHSPEGQ